jgi:hypothetical protein
MTRANGHDVHPVLLGHHKEPCSGVLNPIPERDVTDQLMHELVVPSYGGRNWAEEVYKGLGYNIQYEYPGQQSSPPTPASPTPN